MNHTQTEQTSSASCEWCGKRTKITFVAQHNRWMCDTCINMKRTFRESTHCNGCGENVPVSFNIERNRWLCDSCLQPNASHKVTFTRTSSTPYDEVPWVALDTRKEARLSRLAIGQRYFQLDVNGHPKGVVQVVDFSNDPSSNMKNSVFVRALTDQFDWSATFADLNPGYKHEQCIDAKSGTTFTVPRDRLAPQPPSPMIMRVGSSQIYAVTYSMRGNKSDIIGYVYPGGLYDQSWQAALPTGNLVPGGTFVSREAAAEWLEGKQQGSFA